MKPPPVQPVIKTPVPAPRPAAPKPQPAPVRKEEPQKAATKKYGSKLDGTSSPSRSRNTTKELIRKNLVFILIYRFKRSINILTNNFNVFHSKNKDPPDDSSMGPPKFIEKLASTKTINDGDTLELKVKVHGDPEPQIKWSKNDKVSLF